MTKNETDFYFTARLGVLFSLIFFVLVFLGSCAKNEPKIELIRPQFKVEANEQVSPPAEPRTLIEEIEYVFGDQAELAKKVAFCESSLIPTRRSKISSAKGLFQIIDSTFRTFKCSGDPLNYVDNIRCAKTIYDYYGEFGTRGGWEASQKCWSK
jgi:hypothetical protein